MRVPLDPPPHSTYDRTEKIGFLRWLTSSAAQRRDWRDRRNAAIHTSATIRRLQAGADRTAAYEKELRARHEAEKAAEEARGAARKRR
jgi:hypothetical protein